MPNKKCDNPYVFVELEYLRENYRQKYQKKDSTKSDNVTTDASCNSDTTNDRPILIGEYHISGECLNPFAYTRQLSNRFLQQDGIWMYEDPMPFHCDIKYMPSASTITRMLYDPNPFVRASCAFLFSNPEEIIAQDTTELENNPDDGMAHLRLYYAYLRINDLEKAIDHIALAGMTIPEVTEYLS